MSFGGKGWALIVFLFISLCANAVLFFLLVSGGEQFSQTRDDRDSSRAQPKKEMQAGALRRCEQTLIKCKRAKSYGFFSEQLRMAAAHSAAEEGDRSDSDDYPLCKIAKEGIRFEWRKNRDGSAEGLKKHLADPEDQERAVQEAVDGFSSILKLNDAERATLEERYRPMRAEWMKAFSGFVEEGKVNFEGVYYQTEEFFDAEDKLIGDLFGHQSMNELHKSKFIDRLRWLAGFATLADLPWDVLPKSNE